jgi:hypothetical protein
LEARIMASKPKRAAKTHALDPEAYLRHVIGRIGSPIIL